MLISHNLGLISQNCHRVIVMYAGRVVEELSADQLLTAPLHPYTVALLGAVPDMARSRDEALESIPGQAPDVANLPAGCPFHPRCPRAIDRCTSERPPLLLRPGSGHRVACWVANEDL
jgi:peptide/nickel transport system ATP-binding protein